MPILATGSSRRQRRYCHPGAGRDPGDRGFTLIELLVVLAIIGVMSAVVVLAIPDPRGRLVDEAEKFAARAVAARDNAIVNARTTRVEVAPGGYRFEQRRGGSWAVMVNKPLTPARWREGTTSSVAQVDFNATGVAAPQSSITLQRGEERVSIAIGADGGVHVEG